MWVWGPGRWAVNHLQRSGKKTCFLKVLLELRGEQFLGWSMGGVGMASWRKCQRVLRTLGSTGWGDAKLLEVEKLKALVKAWSWARRS